MSAKYISDTALYLTFRLAEEMFSINVFQVREILDWSPITKVPQLPDFMRGIINVRGSVVPVVDMRLKFGMTPVENTVNTRIILLELTFDGQTTVLGAIADSVHDVIELAPDMIEDPPRIGNRWRSDFIKGIAKSDDQFVIILDIDRIFTSDELGIVDTCSMESLSTEAG